MPVARRFVFGLRAARERFDEDFAFPLDLDDRLGLLTGGESWALVAALGAVTGRPR